MILFKIQRFCLHDGPGIRTTFFFKGCPLRCVWCHNPESWRPDTESFHDYQRCTNCRQCDALSFCPLDLKGQIGQDYTIEALVSEAMKDMSFYQTSGGGVTLSGGEVLSQPLHSLIELVEALRDAHIPIALDTSGYGAWSTLEALVPYLDCILYDIKSLSAQDHLTLTGVDNVLILENLKHLLHIKAKLCHNINQPTGIKPFRLQLRLPLIRGLNDRPKDLRALVAFLDNFDDKSILIDQIDLLAYHALGQHKGSRLVPPIDLSTYKAPSEDTLSQYFKTLNARHYTVTLGGAP